MALPNSFNFRGRRGQHLNEIWENVRESGAVPDYTPQQEATLKNLIDKFKRSGWKRRHKLKRKIKKMMEGKAADGSGLKPGFDSDIDEETGLLKDQLRIGEFDPVELNTQGLEAIRQRALNEGPSAWANMMMDRQAEEQKAAKDAMAAQLAGGQADAEGRLARSGGVSDATRERMARGGLRDLLKARQQVNREGIRDRMNIGLQDEQQRLDLLTQLPGMETQKFNADAANRKFEAQRRKFDINNAIRERDNERLHDFKTYQEDMKKWAAGKQSKAQQKAAGAGSGGGCFITGAVCGTFGLPDNCDLLMILRGFRDTYMKSTPEMKEDVKEYYKIAPKIVEAINEERDKKQIYSNLLVQDIIPCAQHIVQGNEKEAYSRYKKMVKNLKEKYLS